MEAETALQKQHRRGTWPGRQNRPEQTPPDHAAQPRRSAATTRFYACASARICRSTAEPPGGAAGPRLPAPPLVPGARGAAARRGRYPPRQRGLSGRHGEETQEAQVGQAPLRGWVGKGVAKRAPSLGPAGRAQLKGRGKPGPGGEPRPGLGTRGRAGRGETAWGGPGLRVCGAGAAEGRPGCGGNALSAPLDASFLCCVKEYVEKPLKLVLKVGGNEVAELSTGSAGLDSSLYEDKSEHEKHKDRKRKKRKKGEKQVPGEEKEKRKRKVKVCIRAFVY